MKIWSNCRKRNLQVFNKFHYFTLGVLNWFQEPQYMFTFPFHSTSLKGNWNPFLWKTRPFSSCTVHTMAADELMIHGAGVATVLTLVCPVDLDLAPVKVDGILLDPWGAELTICKAVVHWIGTILHNVVLIFPAGWVYSYIPMLSSGPFCCHGLTWISAWIWNHMPGKLGDEITYPFLNFNSCTVEV